jgi:hypothetical protein
MKKAILVLILFNQLVYHSDGKANDNIPNDLRIIESAKIFLLHFYKDYNESKDVLSIRKYFSDKFGQEYLMNSLLLREIYKIDKIEILKGNVLKRNPPIVELFVKEIFSPDSPRPYHDIWYKVRSNGELEWEIIELGEPGVP